MNISIPSFVYNLFFISIFLLGSPKVKGQSEQVQPPNKDTTVIIGNTSMNYEDSLLQVALERVQKAEKDQDIKTLMLAQFMVGNVFIMKEQYKAAFDWLYKALEHAEDLASPIHQGMINANLALAYRRHSKLDSASLYYPEAIKFFSIAKDTIKELTTANDYAQVLRLIDKKDEAISIYENNLPRVEAVQDTDLLSGYYIEYATTLTMNKDHTKALQYFSKAIQITHPDQLPHHFIIAKYNIAKLYFETQSYEQAQQEANSILTDFKNLVPDRFYPDLYSILSKIMEAQKDYSSALEYERKRSVWQDSLHEKQQYEAYKASENRILDSENTIYRQRNEIALKEIQFLRLTALSIIILLGLSILLIWLQSKNKRLRQQQLITNLEKKIYQLQMNPHFFFNVLTSFQAHLMEHPEDTNQIIQKIGNLGTLFRRVLEYSRRNTISLREEKEYLSAYLELEAFQNDYKLNYEISIPEDLKDIQIPPMLIQPFVENAIQHSGIQSQEDGLLQVHFEKSNSQLTINIIDNGKKIDNLQLKSHKKALGQRKSLAQQLTKERLRLLFGDLSKYTFNLEPTGAKVTISIPLS